MEFAKIAAIAAVFAIMSIIIVGALALFWSSTICISEQDARQAVIEYLGGADAYNQEHGVYVREIPFSVGRCVIGGRGVGSYENSWFVTNSGKVIH